MTTKPLDLAEIRTQLSQARGQHYWRSLEELANTAEFQEFLFREFPRQASEWPTALSRRNFLKLMSASLALAGLTACCPGRPPEEIVPYVQAPEDQIPGKPLFFATAMTLGGYATGLLVESHLNRPTKIEGNPGHPASLGATDALIQASILTLYDPDRAQTVTSQGESRDWEAFLKVLQGELEQQRASQGAGLRILTETITSPTLTAQIQELLTQFPAATWHQYEPINRDNVYAGAQLAFAEAVEPIYRFDQAEVIVSLDADFLTTHPGSIRYARDFAGRRRVSGDEASRINRLYVIESTPTTTGVMADHRLPLKAALLESFARALAQGVGIDVASGDQSALQSIPEQWLDAIIGDLQAHQGASLIIAGDHQPPLVHALVHAINEALGNVGKTVSYVSPVTSPAGQVESLRELVTAMTAGQVALLMILGGNPVYNAPVDFNFAAALDKAKFRVHLGLYEDETSEHCQWRLPESHYLEAWSDARAYDGTITIMQPLIEPLYKSRSAHQVVAALLGQSNPSDHDIVRGYWEKQSVSGDFDQFWQTTLFNGVVADTTFAAKSLELKTEFTNQPPSQAPGADILELIFRPDPTIWDGRFANNGWLQELPKPLTKLTWDNALLISPASAQNLGLANEAVVELQYQGRSVRAPVWLVPSQAEGSVTVCLGYGRTRAGKVGTGQGFNAYALRTADLPWFGPGLQIVKSGERYPLATTQMHQSMEGRELIRAGTVEQFRSEPNFAQKPDAHILEISLYPKFEYNDNAWGMVVDLNACNGCNACVVACQAENNIPIVGKEQVIAGREMHWIRLDRYYQGDLDNPETYQQPVMCMHCENAPCEVVCPVGATMHDHEGLNAMVYNRCIGTRYCSNNCPYKVRRFNFLQYTDLETESLKLQRNPEVTVRSRGVMEKCTYCVQRISAARITAKGAGREIGDGEVVTACQSACPTQAIVFGNLNDPKSQVAKLKASPLNYGLLTELNTHPRTTYLAKLKNPHPDLLNLENGG